MPEQCYGRTNGGSPCELPAGHYPATHHLVTYANPRGFLSWTDESMAEFACTWDRDKLPDREALDAMIDAAADD